MDRIYLYVPPEEYAEVKAAGGSWDEHLKVWYIASDVASTAFARWLEGTGAETEFGITSDEAYVASAQTRCTKCGEAIEVICIYCEYGTDNENGDPMARFTVSNIWAMDDALAAQLQRWPYLKPIESDCAAGDYANHCPHCGAPQEDHLLHDEPGDIFFAPLQAIQGAIEFTPLVGRIQLSGDFTCEI